MDDDETCFWIGHQVANKKNTGDIQPLFKEGKQRPGDNPSVLISDGGPDLHVPYKKEFFTLKNPLTKYVQHIGDNCSLGDNTVIYDRVSLV